MKKQIIILFLSGLAASLFAAPMYVPLVSTRVTTAAMGGWPAYTVEVELTADFKHIRSAFLEHDGERIDFPADALAGIEFPDLQSLQIEVEKGRDGRRWVALVFQPRRPTEHPTRYHIAVIDGAFAHVSRTWDEPHGTSIQRNREILYQVD